MNYSAKIEELLDEINQIIKSTLFWVQLTYKVSTKIEAIAFVLEEIEHYQNLSDSNEAGDYRQMQVFEAIRETERMLNATIF